MNARSVNAAAGVVQAAMEQGRQTATGIAVALESAGLLMSPETAAELERLREERHSTNESVSEAAEALRRQRDRIAELEARPSRAEVIRTITRRLANRASLYGDSRTVNEVMADLRQLAGWVEEIQPAATEEVTPQVAGLRELLAGQRAAVEDPHDGPLAHRYRIPRDLPPLDGVR